MVWAHTPFDEAHRLGMSQRAELAARRVFPAETGVLAVEQVLVGGPADPARGVIAAVKRAEPEHTSSAPTQARATPAAGVGITARGADEQVAGWPAPLPSSAGAMPTPSRGLEPGDVLCSVNGVPLTHFLPLEEVADNTAALAVAYARVALELGVAEEVEAAITLMHAQLGRLGARGDAAAGGKDGGGDGEAALAWMARAHADGAVALAWIARARAESAEETTQRRLAQEESAARPVLSAQPVSPSPTTPRPALLPPLMLQQVSRLAPACQPSSPTAEVAPAGSVEATLQPLDSTPPASVIGLDDNSASAFLPPHVQAGIVALGQLRAPPQAVCRCMPSGDPDAGSGVAGDAMPLPEGLAASIRRLFRAPPPASSPRGDAAGTLFATRPLFPGGLADVALCGHAPHHAQVCETAAACLGAEGSRRSRDSPSASSAALSIPAPAALCRALVRVHAATWAFVRAVAEAGPAAAAVARSALSASLACVLSHCALWLEVERGGMRERVCCRVGDHHAGLPSAFLEVSGAVIHAASWMAARNNSVPMGGCYVSHAGYMLSRADVPQHALLTAVAGCPTPDLTALEAALAALPDGARVPLRYTLLGDAHRQRLTVLTMDRTWHEMGMWTRCDARGSWAHRSAAGPPPPTATKAQTSEAPGPAVTFPRLSAPDAPPAAHAAWRSLALCECQIPQLADGVHAASFVGCAVVLRLGSSAGLAVTDRNTVPIACCDVQLTFAGSIEVPASVVFLHPHHNFALLRFDPRPLVGLGVAAVQLSPPEAPLAVGACVHFVGLTNTSTPVTQACVVTKHERLNIGDAAPPRYRAYNHDALHFDRVASCLGGVFLDASGRVGALWASYGYSGATGEPREMSLGLPTEVVREALESLEGRALALAGDAPTSPMCVEPRIATTALLPSIGAELRTLALSKALGGLGLSQAWAAELARCGGHRRVVLQVRRCGPGTPAAKVLREGDLLLAVAGRPVTTFRDVERALQAPHAVRGASQGAALAQAQVGSCTTCLKPLHDALDAAALACACMPLTLVREGVEMTLQCGTRPLHGCGTQRLVSWAGILVQAAPAPATDRGFVPDFAQGSGHDAEQQPPSPPYCSRWSFGSPAHKAGVRATSFIVEVNGRPTPSLDAFLSCVARIRDAADTRLVCVDLAGRKRVFSLRTDAHYWPTVELVLTKESGVDKGGVWALIRHAAAT